jgi:elongation factor 1-beta
MWFFWTLKEKINVGHVVVTYKIFPEDVVDNFDDLKKKIEACVPSYSSLEGYGEEPIAFGLKALLVQIKFPEDITGLVNTFENQIEKISGVSQVQTLLVRRTSR